MAQVTKEYTMSKSSFNLGCDVYTYFYYSLSLSEGVLQDPGKRLHNLDKETRDKQQPIAFCLLTETTQSLVPFLLSI